jgi:malate synthase
MGGMAAQIPIKDDPAANEAAFAKVEADKLREVRAGHDGTWVAHPGLVPVAKRVFDEYMPPQNGRLNQIDNKREDVAITRDELLAIPAGAVTEKGIRQNISVGIQYLAAWLGGSGAVPLYHLMEDAATAEISRTQLWQWVQHGATTDTGELVSPTLYRRLRDEELATIASRPHVARAAQLFDDLILSPELADFLTIPAYAELLKEEALSSQLAALRETTSES